MGHFEDLEDLGLKTSVSVLGIRPGPRSELKTLDRLAHTPSSRKRMGTAMQNRDVETAVLIQVEGRLNYPMECENGKGAGKGEREALSVIAWQRL